MNDDFGRDPAFDSVRETVRRAPVAAAAEVRRRGHQRRVRARALCATTAVVVLSGGAGAAFAAQDRTTHRTVQPQTSTSAPAPTPSLSISAAPATTVPAATAPATTGTPDSPVTTAAPTTPVTPATVTTSAAAPPTGTTAASTSATTTAPSTPSIHIDLYRTPVGSTTFNYRIEATGFLYQSFQLTTGAKLTGSSDAVGGMQVHLDGKPIDGADGGEVQCHSGAPLVPVSASIHTSQPITITPGTHTMVIDVRTACNNDGTGGIWPGFSRTITFTVQ
ncbi:MAG: hypothetical protein QOJ11_1419 [Frankiales bacterium]|nr:hypothetical protein [Frankiales bacterium]